jgi:hypothetical protein
MQRAKSQFERLILIENRLSSAHAIYSFGVTFLVRNIKGIKYNISAFVTLVFFKVFHLFLCNYINRYTLI